MAMRGFPVTRWTLILSAGKEKSAAADEAVAELCRAYWFPVYAFVRRFGTAPDEAEDLTQDFFARFIEMRNLLSADPAKGRFRSFLLTSVKHFLSDQAERRHAEKRGGKNRVLALNLADAEKRYAREFAAKDTPESLFEREWAVTLMARVNDNVRTALGREGHAGQFDRLKPFLPGGDEEPSYSEVAARLGTSEGALKVAVHRFRRRYREVFRAEIAHLVSDPDLVEDEVRHLLQVLRS